MNYVAGWIICDDTEFAINFNSANVCSGSIASIGGLCRLCSVSRQKAVVPQPEFKAPSTSALGQQRKSEYI